MSDERDDDPMDRPAVSEADARAVDADIRALRDTPVDADRMARMRADLDTRMREALDTRVAASEGAAPAQSADADPLVTPISVHPRWRSPVWAAAAAVAAAILIAWLLPRLQTEPIDRAPREVARDSAPEQEEVPRTGQEAAPSRPESLIADAPTWPESFPAESPSTLGPSELEAASDEELAVVLEYEELTDYDVIAQLELLELLDVLETEGRI